MKWWEKQQDNQSSSQRTNSYTTDHEGYEWSRSASSCVQAWCWHYAGPCWAWWRRMRSGKQCLSTQTSTLRRHCSDSSDQQMPTSQQCENTDGNSPTDLMFYWCTISIRKGHRIPFTLALWRHYPLLNKWNLALHVISYKLLTTSCATALLLMSGNN